MINFRNRNEEQKLEQSPEPKSWLSPRIDALSPTGKFGLGSLFPISPEKDTPPVIWSRREREIEPEIMLKQSPENSLDNCDVLSIDKLAAKRVKQLNKN